MYWFQTILLQHFFIAFTYSCFASSKIVVFDLKENQWFPTKLSGDEFDRYPEFSICSYGDNAILLFGSNDQKESLLNVFSLSKDLNDNQFHIHHERISLQNKLLRQYHSASTCGDKMYIISGKRNRGFCRELDCINLNTLEITQNCDGARSPEVYNHSSISQNKKIYVYGGIDRNLEPNQSIYMLDTETFTWTSLKHFSEIPRTVQFHEDKFYLFGDASQKDNFLSIWNESRNCSYDVSTKGDIPPSNCNWVSVMNGKNMVLFCVEKTDQSSEDPDDPDIGQIYSLSFDTEPENGFINKLIMGSLQGNDQESQEKQALQEVQRLLLKRMSLDILFIVQGKQFPAHKEILKIRSTYFANMFSSGMQESHQQEIIINEISAEVFEAVLDYLYEGALPSDEAIMKELLVYSEEILLKRLKDHCEKILVNSVTKENAVELYQLSNLSASEKLREAASKCLEKNPSYFIDQLASLSIQQSEGGKLID